MSETIHIDELVLAVKRSARRKTVGVTVERDKTLVAHLPADVALDDAAGLIRRRVTWIYKKLDEQLETPRQDVFRRPEFVDGEGFYFLGQHYRLKLVESAKGVEVSGDRILFPRKLVHEGEKHIAAFYRDEGNQYLGDVIDRWKRVMGVEPANNVKIGELGFRWGSCSSGKTLNFHWRVMQLPPKAIDYVVVHELAHIRFRSHSDAFWQLVRTALPEFLQWRDWLRKKGGDL